MDYEQIVIRNTEDRLNDPSRVSQVSPKGLLTPVIKSRIRQYSSNMSCGSIDLVESIRSIIRQYSSNMSCGFLDLVGSLQIIL